MGVGRGLIFSPLLSTRVSLQVFECVQMWVHVHVGLCVCLCVFCSPAAAAPTRDSGSICRELKPDVMQQESPPQKSQVPTAAREITLKHCVCVCMYIYLSSVPASVWVCVFVYLSTRSSQYTPVLLAHQGLSAGTLLSSCREKNCFQLFYKLLGERKKTVELQHVPADIQLCAFSILNDADSLNGIEVCLCRPIRLATDPH